MPGAPSIVGSGLLARAFAAHATASLDACFYAAGVSNSGCRDPREFNRERDRLEGALREQPARRLFIYFGTCSIYDETARSDYVQHKLRMEEMVRARPRHLVFRLPQVAGRTPNPHTLLNYLYARMARSERFQIWSKATRNVIDIDDVARIALELIHGEGACNETINVAADRSHAMPEIVAQMERVIGRRAIFDVVERGTDVPIDTTRVRAAVARCAIAFDDAYLGSVIEKYYGHRPRA